MTARAHLADWPSSSVQAVPIRPTWRHSDRCRPAGRRVRAAAARRRAQARGAATGPARPLASVASASDPLSRARAVGRARRQDGTVTARGRPTALPASASQAGRALVAAGLRRMRVCQSAGVWPNRTQFDRRVAGRRPRAPGPTSIGMHSSAFLACWRLAARPTRDAAVTICRVGAFAACRPNGTRTAPSRPGNQRRGFFGLGEVRRLDDCDARPG